MPREEPRIPATVAPGSPAARHSPRWRALLEARWQARLHEITELSLAYHAAAAPDNHLVAARREMERLLRRTVVARRKLADVEEALARLAAGVFGRCEQCGAVIPDGLLAVVPETRYCPRCAEAAMPRPRAAGQRPASR
jgi:RNA polymerase-binding transcription factor DksA